MGPRASRNENDEENFLLHWGVSLRLSYQLPSVDFSSIVRYKRTKNHFSHHPIHYWVLVSIITFYSSPKMRERVHSLLSPLLPMSPI